MMCWRLPRGEGRSDNPWRTSAEQVADIVHQALGAWETTQAGTVVVTTTPTGERYVVIVAPWAGGDPR